MRGVSPGVMGAGSPRGDLSPQQVQKTEPMDGGEAIWSLEAIKDEKTAENILKLLETVEPETSEEPSPFITAGTTIRHDAGDGTEAAIKILRKPVGTYNDDRYHNPDPLQRLIGRRNEGRVIVNGENVRALLDTGADISTICSDFCEKHGIPILGDLKGRLNLRGTGEFVIPYKGYVEVTLEVPHLPDYKEDVLMLVLPANPYTKHVPVTLGTKQLDDISLRSEPRMKLEESWDLVRKASMMAMKAAAGYGEDARPKFDLNQVQGSVKLCQRVKIKPGKTVHVRATTNIVAHSKRVHVITSPSEEVEGDLKGVQMAESYGMMKPGSSRVDVMLHNPGESAVTLPRGMRIGEVQAANEMPKALVAKQRLDELDAEMDAKLKEAGATPETEEKKDQEKPGWPGYWETGGTRVPTHFDPTKPLPPSELRGEPKPIPKRELTQEQKEKFLGGLDLGDLGSWSPALQEEAKELLCRYENVFSRGELDMGHTTKIKHDIVLTDPQPFRERYRRIAPHLYSQVKAHLEEMLRVGAIARSYSPWASPVTLAKKKDGSLRFCLDLRRLNNRTVKDAYTLPRIEETLDSLAGSRIFSALDLKAGYWQVEMTERARPYTAFTAGPLGFYECVRMPFRLTNAPATFQRLMESCLGNLHLQSVLVYLDDVIIFSSNPKDHLNSLRKVLQKMEDNGLKLKSSKCKFFQTSMEFLGHTIGADGVRASRERIKDLLEWKVPRTVTEL